MPGYVGSIEGDIFSDCNQDLLVVVEAGSPAAEYIKAPSYSEVFNVSVIQDEYNIDHWIALSNRLRAIPGEIVDPDSSMRSEDGVLYCGSALLVYPYLSPRTCFEIPAGVISVSAPNLFGLYLKELFFSESCSSIVEQVQASDDSLAKIRVDENNLYYRDIDGVLFSQYLTCLLHYPAKRNVQVFNVPSGVIELSNSCFEFCEIEQIVLPDTLEIIGMFAFYGSQVRKLSIPESVRDIDSTALEYLPNLEELLLVPDSYADQFLRENRDYIDFSEHIRYI